MAESGTEDDSLARWYRAAEETEEAERQHTCPDADYHGPFGCRTCGLPALSDG